jgi:hypothetical protein
MQDFVDEAVEFEKKARYAARVERFAEYLNAHADAAAMEAKALQKERKRARKQRRQEEEEAEEDEDEEEEEEEEEDDEEQREEEDGIVMETLINESLERLQLNVSGSPFTYHNKKKEEENSNGDGALLAKACRHGQLSNVEWILDFYSRDALLPVLGDAWEVVKDLPDTNPIKRAIVNYKKGEKTSK